jgi:hypothetical protein
LDGIQSSGILIARQRPTKARMQSSHEENTMNSPTTIATPASPDNPPTHPLFVALGAGTIFGTVVIGSLCILHALGWLP